MKQCGGLYAFASPGFLPALSFEFFVHYKTEKGIFPQNKIPLHTISTMQRRIFYSSERGIRTLDTTGMNRML